MVLLGVIILIGIVVNNAIVLIDYTNQLRDGRLLETRGAEGRRRSPAASDPDDDVEQRSRLLPMALGWGEGAEIRSPMAIAVIGGMLFSTMLTLIFIPVMYELLDRKRYPGDVRPRCRHSSRRST